MKTFAVIEDGTVTNCIVAESKETAETQTEKTCIEYFLVTPGWNYSDGVFSPPITEE
jgi:hypothetical protein